MMTVSMVDAWVGELTTMQEFFNRSTRPLDELDSQFAPADGMMSVAGQVAHVAKTVDWFVEGLERPDGFDMDFEAHMKEAAAVTSLNDARAWFDRAVANAVATVQRLGEAAMMEPLPKDTIMGGMPKMTVIGSIAEHTAHHRGALTVYTRLLGKTPLMPYMEV